MVVIVIFHQVGSALVRIGIHHDSKVTATWVRDVHTRGHHLEGSSLGCGDEVGWYIGMNELGELQAPPRCAIVSTSREGEEGGLSTDFQRTAVLDVATAKVASGYDLSGLKAGGR